VTPLEGVGPKEARKLAKQLKSKSLTDGERDKTVRTLLGAAKTMEHLYNLLALKDAEIAKRDQQARARRFTE